VVDERNRYQRFEREHDPRACVVHDGRRLNTVNSEGVYERENLTIAPGEIVSRKYSGAGFNQNDQPQAVNCRVDWVQFADGTTWSASGYQRAR